MESKRWQACAGVSVGTDLAWKQDAPSIALEHFCRRATSDVYSPSSSFTWASCCSIRSSHSVTCSLAACREQQNEPMHYSTVLHRNVPMTRQYQCPSLLNSKYVLYQ